MICEAPRPTMTTMSATFASTWHRHDEPSGSLYRRRFQLRHEAPADRLPVRSDLSVTALVSAVPATWRYWFGFHFVGLLLRFLTLLECTLSRKRSAKFSLRSDRDNDRGG